MSDAYKVCPKCGLRYSALTRHRCAKPKGQDKKPKFDPKDLADMEGGGDTDSLDRHDSEGKGPDGKEGEEGRDGKGEGQAEGGEGDGQGESQDGEGESEGEEQGEGPAPQSPEPDAPIVQIVCTVLKFAALTAACAKNGVIEVTLNEEGLMVYGHNGDVFAFDTIPWGEFEKRSTLDGEFYVKDVIDAVDVKLLGETPMEMRAKKALADYKKDKKAKPVDNAEPDYSEPEPEAPKLTLPLTVGQRVITRAGTIGEVKSIRTNDEDYPMDEKPRGSKIAVVFYETGGCAEYWDKTGKYGSEAANEVYPEHLVADAPF